MREYFLTIRVKVLVNPNAKPNIQRSIATGAALTSLAILQKKAKDLLTVEKADLEIVENGLEVVETIPFAR